MLIVAGLVGLRSDWIIFCRMWQYVLNKHSAKYFHFREWAQASAVVRRKRDPDSKFGENPYKDWNQEKLDAFLFELAEVAVSDGRLIVGGYVPTRKLQSDQAAGTASSNASAGELCVRHFFDSVISTISEERKVLKRLPISVFFDHVKDKQWKRVIQNGYDESCKTHRQFRALTIASRSLAERVESGDTESLPLQAADMVAYRLRQRMEDTVNLDLSRDWAKLDDILFRTINSWSETLTASEKDAILRRFFIIPKDATYEQAMDAITSEAKFKK